MRAATITIVLLLCAAPASAQPTLRDHGRAALREGRFEDALRLFRAATESDRDPSVWLEVGDAADRLRADSVALDAYERYLAARADAPDRVEVLARVEILRALRGRRRTRPADRPDFIPATTILDALREEPPPGLGRRLGAP